MRQSDDVPGTQWMGYEAWRALLLPYSGAHHLKAVEADTFSGWLRPLSVHGLIALDIGCNGQRFERTLRDTRRDRLDHFKAVFQISGQSTFHQNDRAVQLAVGDVALIDAARPVTTCGADGASARWLTVHLPRRFFVSHLGFEPQGGASMRSGTSAGRLLYEIALDALERRGSVCAPADSYMQLAVYDLLGSLFAPTDPPPSSRQTNKLFLRICGLIKDRFGDPDFGPQEVAAEARISLRYLQKLFTQHGSTCSEFIYSLRLDHAARLLDRRELLSVSEPLSEIAYACGFRDYAHFSRKFRRRFGHPPGAHSAGRGGAGHNMHVTAGPLPRAELVALPEQ